MKQHKPALASKRGSLEISVNFIVVMIICLALIGVGFLLISKGSDAFEKEYSKIKAQRESQIKTAMARSGEPVLVYPNTITVDRGDGYIFSVGITNNLGKDENFELLVNWPAAQETDNEILYAQKGGEIITLKNGETVFVPIKITTSKERSKSYIFNICVFAESSAAVKSCPGPDTYGEAQKIILNVK